MYLSGVVVSDKMADYLSETLPHNVRHFDRLLVVTTPEDVDTQRICRYYGIQHVQTDRLRSRWGEFHKAKGINHGLEVLEASGGLGDWVLHMDTDIVLPPKTRQILESKPLVPQYLYGCDRFMVPTAEAWRRHQAMPAMQHDDYHVQTEIFPLGPRFSGGRMKGWAPPGFFQLWNPKGSGIMRYPDEHTTASRTDVLHASQWGSQSRILLGELIVYHLSAGPHQQGANWGGRVTARFGAEPIVNNLHPSRHQSPPGMDHSVGDSWRHPRHRRRRHRHHHHYGPGPRTDADGKVLPEELDGSSGEE